MNKKEIAEIRRQFTPERCAVTRICGCYVDAEKNIKTRMKEAFLSLPEEDGFKYLEIFKKTLSGSVGRNLINLDFPLEEERGGGRQEFLLRLRNSRLKDDDLVEEFYNRIIGSFPCKENYYIVLIHAAYDIPGRAADGLEMFDASDNVYEYILCGICPVSLSKAGLGYNAETNRIENRPRERIVETPVKGFLFPAFNERFPDVHSLLYYTKNAADLQEDFIGGMFGCERIPLPAKEQKETFRTLISDTMGNACDYDVVRSIHETLNEKLEEYRDEPEPLELGKPEVRRIFEESGVPDEQLEQFDRLYDGRAGENASFLAANIAESGQLRIETPDIVIRVRPEAAGMVETRVLDGRPCIVIPAGGHVEVNGVSIICRG